MRTLETRGNVKKCSEEDILRMVRIFIFPRTLNGFSCVCTRKWRIKSDGFLNSLWQNVHEYHLTFPTHRCFIVKYFL